MRRLVALVVIAAAIGGAVFVADHPGHVEIVWQGWQIDTSVGVLAGAAALVALAASVLVLLAAALRRVPRNVRRRRAARRQRAGEVALTRGVVALAAGQPAAAQLAARRAAALLDGVPMALLLAAEAAAQCGDAAAAHGAYSALAERPDSEFLGLRGLIGQALRAGDDAAARRLAERARKLRPEARWVVETLLVLMARAGDWAAARDTLAGTARRRVLPAERVRHHRGVVLSELSREAERRSDPREAARLAARARVLAPDLAALAEQHARLLVGLGRRRAAARTIERAWRTAPHPDLARRYLDLRPEAAPLARAAAVQRLAAQNPEASESHLAVAEAALNAQLWGEARRRLAIAVAAAPPAGPSRRLCRLMARLEESEAGNIAAVRDWLDRAVGAPPDPCYVCARCGGLSAEWQALCRDCDGFDTLLWQSPPAADRAILAPAARADAPLLLPSPAASGLAPPRQSDK